MQTYSVLTDEYAFEQPLADGSDKNLAFSDSANAEQNINNSAQKTEPLNLRTLLARRMHLCGLEHVEIESSAESQLTVRIEDEAELAPFARALGALMALDLRYFEIAKAVEALPFSVDEKRQILSRALTLTATPDTESVFERVLDYLRENSRINLNGFLRFRLRDIVESLHAAVDIAAEEFILFEEYDELMQLLGLFSDIRPADGGEINVMLRPDGSCTVTDGKTLRIDCAPNNNEGVLSLLTGMAPSCVTILDFSGGACEKLCRAICLLFGADVEKE